MSEDIVTVETLGPVVPAAPVARRVPLSLPPLHIPTEDECRDLKPVPDSAIYPGLGDQLAMAAVYETFMRGEGKVTLEDAAAEQGICFRTALEWARKGKWLDRARAVLETAEEEARQRVAWVQLENRLQEFESQLELARALNKEIKSTLERGKGKFGAKDLTNLADAAKSTADIASRAVAISDSGTVAPPPSDAMAKTPLVMIVQGGGVPPVRRAEPIAPG